MKVKGFKYLLDTGSLQKGELLGGFATAAGAGNIAICNAVLNTEVVISPESGGAMIEKAVLESNPLTTEYLWQLGFTPGADLNDRALKLMEKLMTEYEQSQKDATNSKQHNEMTKQKP